MNLSDKVVRLRSVGYADADIAKILNVSKQEVATTNPATEVTIIDKEQPIIDVAYKEQNTADDEDDPTKALRMGALSLVRVVSERIDSEMSDRDIKLVSDTLVKMAKVVGGTNIYVQNNSLNMNNTDNAVVGTLRN